MTPWKDRWQLGKTSITGILAQLSRDTKNTVHLAATTKSNLCPQSSNRKEGEYDELTIGPTAIDLALPTDPSGGTLHECVCGRGFATSRGMKVHRTKMGCLLKAVQDHRTEASIASGKTPGQVGPDANHSPDRFHDPDSDENRQPRARINFPAAASKADWSKLDEILSKLLKVQMKELPMFQVNNLTDTIYNKCLEMFGSKEKVLMDRGEKTHISRRQREIARLKKEKKRLRQQWRRAPDNEKPGLSALRHDLRQRLSALLRAERLRVKKREQRKARFQFVRDPFRYGKSLLDPPKSGTLQVSKEQLDHHFRAAFIDPLGDKELAERSDLPEIPLPKVAFNEGVISIFDISQFLRKTRNRSAPGPNGVPYLVYKKCPGVLKVLHSLLKSAWTSGSVDKEWQKAEGIFIPKEKVSVDINQFRPISLLNVEGKIFFAVLAKRLTSYLTQNDYIDKSIQKGGIPGVPGCIEHSTMIWESIKRAKQNRLSLHVVWLDLANAYGAVRHQLIWRALTMHHVPKFVMDILRQYFQDFHLRLSTKTCSTDWFRLQVGIAMGCSISPILFVLAMQLLLNSVGARVEDVYVGRGIFMPPLRAFMDDTTISLNKCISMRRTLDVFSDLLKWCGMSFKASKSRSLSLRRGKIDEYTVFSVDGNKIPTVSDEPVKSLGRWYCKSLNDVDQGASILRMATVSMESINAAPLQSRFKVWILQFVLVPRLLWPLTVYEIGLQVVEKLERKIARFTRQWLGLPPGLTSVALYGKTAKLRLPLRSFVEDFKISKLRTQMMLDNSTDQRVAEVKPTLISGTKWNARVEIENATVSLQWTERTGAVQLGRHGVGWNHHLWWSKANAQERSDLIVQDRKQAIESERVVKSAQLSQQGDWTRWEETVQRSLSWEDIWRYAPVRLSFLIRSMYDQLPTASNLKKWKLIENDECQLCGQSQSLIHILSSCSYSLSHGRYTWRHNLVLQKLLGFVKEACRKANSMEVKPRRRIYFLREGLPQLNRPKRTLTEGENVFHAANDWRVSADLKTEKCFPVSIKESGKRPDIVVFSSLAKTFLLIELTVPWESNMEASNIMKLERYRELMLDLEANGSRAELFAVEVGARGLVGKSLLKLLRALGMSNRERTRAIKQISEAAESASFWIWSQREKKEDFPNLEAALSAPQE